MSALTDLIYRLKNLSNNRNRESDIAASINQLNRVAEETGRVVNTLTNLVGNRNKVHAVTPVDWVEFRLVTDFGGDMYGVTSAADAVIKKCTPSGVVTTFGTPLPVGTVSCIKFISDKVLLVEVNNGGSFPLYRSTDAGATWDLVYAPPMTSSKMLTDRSIEIAHIGGSKVLLYGTYNVNGSRTAGAANDGVYLLKSTDFGATWSEVTRWNTDGAVRNVRHIHCVKQDPDSGRIFVCTGDSNAESAIYSWDGVATWPVNINPANLPQSAGLMCKTGTQAHRAVDLAFDNDKLYWLPDVNSGSANNEAYTGIFSHSVDFTKDDMTRVAAAGSNLKGNAGWLSCRHSDGTIYFCTGVDSVNSGYMHSAIIASNFDKTEWKAVAAYRSINNEQIAPFGFCAINDKFYLSCSKGSGKTDENMAVFEKSENLFMGEFKKSYVLDTIHPVFWVDSVNGSNSNNGRKPSSAFASIDYAVGGDRATYGASVCVLDAETVYTGANIQPKFNANAKSGDPVEFMYLCGYGATKTKLTVPATSSATAIFQLTTNANNALFGLKDMSIAAGKSLRYFDCFGANTKLNLVRCIAGDVVNGTGLIRAESSAVNVLSSLLSPATVLAITASSGASSFSFSAERMASIGGSDILRYTTTGVSNSVDLLDCVFSGFSSNVIDSVAGDFSSFKANGLTISSSVSGAAAISGAATGWNGKVWNSTVGCPTGVDAAFAGDVVFNASPVSIDVLKYVF